MTGKGKKTGYVIITLWRVCMVLFFCFAPFETAFSYNMMDKTPQQCHANVSCHAIKTDNHTAHDKTSEMVHICSNTCVMMSFATVSDPVSLEPANSHYSLSMPILAGIDMQPQLPPPLFLKNKNSIRYKLF